jgi:hypothetical protein
MIFQVVGIVHFTVLYILSLVEGFSVDEVDTFSAFVNHVLLKEDFYLKIVLHFLCAVVVEGGQSQKQCSSSPGILKNIQDR